MTIESLSSANLEPLVNLVLELWPGCTYEEEIGHYRKLMDADEGICYLAKDQDAYAAFIHASIRHDYVEGADEDAVAYVEAIYVQPAFQKRGIATDLLKRVEDWAMSKGLRQIASDTAISNAAGIRFHERSGFAEAGRIICFIKQL